MLQIFGVTLRLAVLAAVFIWCFRQDGTVSFQVFEYTVRMQAGMAFASSFVILLLILFIHRIMLGLFDIPRALSTWRVRRRTEKGMRALTLGMTAVAAGDAKMASYHAFRARKFLPQDKGLPLLLDAQALRLKGQSAEAKDVFQSLLDNRDTAFLGLRGLLIGAMEEGDMAQALTLARQAQKLHPAQAWILQLVYALLLRTRQWAEAQKTLQQAVKTGAIPRDRAQSDLIALYIQQSDEAAQRGDSGLAVNFLKKAAALDPGFTPTALRLIRLHSAGGHRRAAVKVAEAAWKKSPHPELVPLWDGLAPPNKPNDLTVRLRWYERLLALRPDDVESQIAAARAALEDGLWGEARQYLALAEKLQPCARLYRLWAKLAERQHQPEEARLWLERAADSKPDKVWTCTATGRIYESWRAVAEPHGAFNTIIWDYPESHVRGDNVSLLPYNDLLISPPARLSQI